MADALIDKVEALLQETAAQIKRNMEANNINASGRTSDSIHVGKTGENSVSIFAGGQYTAPIESVEMGSLPSGDWMDLRPRIVVWTREKKGFHFKNESHRWAVATVISKNIQAHGTRRYRKHINVYSAEVNAVAEKIAALIKEETEKSVALSLGHKITTNTNKL